MKRLEVLRQYRSGKQAATPTTTTLSEHHSFVPLIMRSTFTILALASTFVPSEARLRVHNQELKRADYTINKTEVLDYIKSFFLSRHENDKRDVHECDYDNYYQALESYTSATPFCSAFLGLSPTFPSSSHPRCESFSRMIWCLSNEYSTVTSVFATATIVTGQEVTTIAAGGTVTVTETADASATVQKRDAQITAAPHADLYRHLLARQNSNFTSPAANSSVASALSSACSCLNIPASETTLTFTTDAVVSSTHYGHMSIN